MRIAKDVTHSSVEEAKERVTLRELQDWCAYFVLEAEVNDGAMAAARAKGGK